MDPPHDGSAAVTLLVTGGNGFVMSNLVRHWLEAHPGEAVTILDRDDPDPAARDFFVGLAGRIRWLRCDIRDRSWHAEARDHGIDRILHGAAVTPHPWTDAEGRDHDPEREDPELAIEVNLGGTLAVLDFARRLSVCQRLLLVGTASVYGDGDPSGRPRSEEDTVAPAALYGISKYAAELVALRFRELYDLPLVVARLGAVYGPMDRLLDSRHIVCAPNRIVTLALAGEAIGLDDPVGVGDWIHATDVAAALSLLLEAPMPRHTLYNVASGGAQTLARLADLVTAAVPGSTWGIVPGQPTVRADPDRRLGCWGGYAISRMRREFDWAPAPLEQRLGEYIAWRKNTGPAEAGRPS
jgi:nucleoside-diphosphate-sugar epimerase